jgi:hypothetical protein
LSTPVAINREISMPGLCVEDDLQIDAQPLISAHAMTAVVVLKGSNPMTMLEAPL